MRSQRGVAVARAGVGTGRFDLGTYVEREGILHPRPAPRSSRTNGTLTTTGPTLLGAIMQA